MRQSTHVRTLVEMALIRICKLEDLDSLPALVAQLRDGVPISLQPPAVAGPQTPSITAPSAEKKTRDISLEGVGPSQVPPEPHSPEASATTVQHSEPDQQAPLDRESALAAWRQTLAEHQDMTGDCASKFDSVAISAPNRLVVSFRKAYTTAKEFCERPDKRTRLEQTLSRLAGQDIRIDFAVLADESQVTVPQPLTTRPPVNSRQRRAEMQRYPLVRRAIEMFDAEIVTIVDPIVAEAEVSDQTVSSEPVVEASP
jgi:DNA polymerase-3 subunit gamma/tau